MILSTIATNILAIAKITPDDPMFSALLVTASELFINAYAKRARDTINKGFNTSTFKTSYTVELVEDSNVGRLISLNPIYSPVRLETTGNSPFISVSSTDGVVTFLYVNERTARHIELDTFLHNVHLYTYKNNKLIVFNNNLLSEVEVTAVFEMPHLVEFGNEALRSVEAGEELEFDFPCSRDMINSISLEVAQLLAAGQQQAK